jgi:hypothetical protein
VGYLICLFRAIEQTRLLRRQLKRSKTFSCEYNETDLLRDEAAAFMENQRGNPWLAMVATRAPHGPYWPPKRHAQRFDDVKLPKTPAFD